MKVRTQKTLAEVNGCPQRARTESEWYGGAQTFMWMCEDNIVEVPFDKEHLLERILSPDNLNQAYKAVVRNKGCGGIDKMSCEELLPWLLANKDSLIHSKLIEILSRTIKDGRVVSLIHKYLRSGVINKGLFEANEEGTPQGGPLSPLLSNIMLNELDKELERRCLPFVRYADDSMIFCKSKRAAMRVKESITKFIEGKLYLKVNKEKTVVSYVRGVKYLGYSFYVSKGKCQLTVHPKSKAKMKAKLKELTNRSNGWGYTKRKQKLEEYIRGWVGYYHLANMKRMLQKMDEWLRRRIRMCIWKAWKLPKTRICNLIRCGISQYNARTWGYCKGYWRVSGSPIMQVAASNVNLRKAGYATLLGAYLEWNPK